MYLVKLVGYSLSQSGFQGWARSLWAGSAAGLLLLATPSFAAGGKKPGSRERVITREATLKSKDQKSLDFDAVDIGGQRKSPMGTLINQNKSDKEYDFVKIRLRWHPEMVQSASSLDVGKSR